MSTPAKNDEKKKRHAVRNTVLSCILVCMLCFCTVSLGTYAYFTDSTTTPQSTISSANYQIEVQGITQTADEEGVYTLPVGEYQITLTAKGTASTGYVFVRSGNTLSYSEQLTPQEVGTDGQNSTITFQLKTQTQVQLAYRWGRHGQQSPAIQNGVSLIVEADGTASVSA